MIEKVAAKLPVWQGPLMPRSSRLVLIKAVLCSIPIYMMMAEQLPPWAMRGLEGICRKFFWEGADASVRGKCMVNWETVCSPRITMASE